MSLIARVAARRKESDKNDRIINDRAEYIAALETGEAAKWFVEDVKKHGINEKGEQLIILPWLEEYARLIADMRIGTIYTSGCAQVGKTLLHILLLCWLSTMAKLNTIYCYAQERTMNRCVPLQFRPVMESWLKKVNISIKGNDGSRNNTLYQVPGGTNIFTYVSTSKTTESNKGGASAGSSVVSVSADIAFLEERSQYPPGADAPVERRLDAGRLKNHPIRQLGTPGHGKGIESEIEKADYVFYPHIDCQCCGERIALNPKGTLLKPFIEKLPSGEKKTTFLSPSGKPIEWFYKDEKDPEGSAYFGCSNCGTEIPKEQRIYSTFYCIKTGIGLTELLDNFPVSDRRYTAGIILSPLLRNTNYNLAADIIRGGQNTSNPDDWQQQRLGLPSETGETSITIPMIERAIAAPRPEVSKNKVFTIAGIDQGRSEHWMVIIEYHLPEDYLDLATNEIIDKTIRVVKIADGIIKTDLPNLLDRFNVNLALIDNEPDRDVNIGIPRLHIADQKPKLRDAVKQTTVLDGGVEYDAWDIRNDKFLKQVLNVFTQKADDGYPLVRLPQSWEKWVRIQNERSPVRHLTSVRYEPALGEWLRPDDHVDHFYYAFMFAEAAFHIQLTHDLDTDFSWIGEM